MVLRHFRDSLGMKTFIFDGSRISRQLPDSFFNSLTTIFHENSLRCVSQSPYSFDLAYSDFWLFGQMKTALQGYKFAESEQLLERIYELLNEVQSSELVFVFHYCTTSKHFAFEITASDQFRTVLLHLVRE
jgi:hypothetical protein